MAALEHMKAAAALAALLCAAAVAGHASLQLVTRSSLRPAELLSVKRCVHFTRNEPPAQVEDGSTACQRHTAHNVSEKVTVNATFLLAANIAEQCQDCCELRLRHLDSESNASAVFAAAPLLSVNTLRVQLPVKQGCSLVLEAACAAGTSCQAGGEVVLDDVVWQQYAASTDPNNDSMSSSVTTLSQSIVVQHATGDAGSTLPAVNAHQSTQSTSISIVQLALYAVWLVAVVGLQACLLLRMRDQDN